MSEQIGNILFVCLGNICRSPFAEALFKKLSEQRSRKGFSADSAGLYALHGNPATAMAQKVAAEHGVDLAAHAAKPVTKSLVDWSDLILAMERSHCDELLREFPASKGKIRLMKRFARFGARNRAIADPYGLNYDAYRFCYLDIADAVSGLIDFLSDGTGDEI